MFSTKIKFTIITAIIASLSFPAMGFDFEANGLYYNILSSKNEVEITYDANEHSSYSGIIHVPAKVTNNGTEYAVTAIGDKAFYNSKITAIHIPDNITRIGDHAFYFSEKLVNITLPQKLKTLAQYALSGTAITSIVVPEGITTISNSCFLSCESLHTVFLPSSITKIDAYGFYACHSLKEIYLPAEAVPNATAFAVFQGIEEIDFIVPENSTSKYEANAPWNDFAIYPPDPFTLVMTIHGNSIGEYDELTLDDYNAFRIYEGDKLLAITSAPKYLLPNSETKTYKFIPTNTFFDADPLYYSTKGTGGISDTQISDNSIKLQGKQIIIENPDENAKVEITDIIGRRVYSLSAKSSIDLSTLPSGIYIAKYKEQAIKIAL